MIPDRMTPEARADLLTERHGEVCTRTVAAKILGRSPQTINAMLRDGRLDAACGGTMVDVRSIARYIHQPAEADFEARNRRYKQRHNTEWAV